VDYKRPQSLLKLQGDHTSGQQYHFLGLPPEEMAEG
jgi:hypothetical protein